MQGRWVAGARAALLPSPRRPHLHRPPPRPRPAPPPRPEKAERLRAGFSALLSEFSIEFYDFSIQIQ